MNTMTMSPVKILMEGAGVNYSFVDTIYDGVYKGPITRWTVLLPGSGCSWARKKHKGCSFCAFNARIDEVTGGRLIPHDEMMEFCTSAQERVKDAQPHLAALFNGGNFINDLEIDPQAQIDILKTLSQHPTLKTILFESKTEYLSHRKLAQCLEAVGSKKIRVAIGLETKDDYLRNTIINKGMSKQAYERAIRRLHALGIEVQSYVFMKPYTLTEKQAIEEAVDTIQYAVDCGSDIVMLEAAMVQKGTAFEEAFNKGEFDSPWLWSLREVIKRTNHLPQLNVGIFDEEPKPLSYPKNCPECTDQFNQAFHHFRKTHDFSRLDILNCSCWSNWAKVISPFAN